MINAYIAKCGGLLKVSVLKIEAPGITMRFHQEPGLSRGCQVLNSGSYGPSNVLDGDRSTFFAGDHDIGVSVVGFYANFDAVGQ